MSSESHRGAEPDAGEHPEEPDGDPTIASPRTPPDAVGRAFLRRVRATARERGAQPGAMVRRARSTRGSGSAPRGRDPQLLGSALEHLFRDRGWQEQVSIGGVVSRWRHIVGDEVAAHCDPVDFADGVLTVQADSTSWATQLRLLSGQILAAIAREVGDGAVDDLHVKGPRGPGFGRGMRSVRGRGPRDTFG